MLCFPRLKWGVIFVLAHGRATCESTLRVFDVIQWVGLVLSQYYSVIVAYVLQPLTVTSSSLYIYSEFPAHTLDIKHVVCSKFCARQSLLDM